MKRTCIIFNEKSGRAGDFKHRLSAFASKYGSDFCTKRDGESTEGQARRAMGEGFERIVVAGGDGTVSHVVNGIAPDFGRVELGVIPLGTGNDFARSLGLPLDDLNSSVAIAFGDQTRDVDMLRVTGAKSSYIVNAASGGMAGKVAADVMEIDKSRWGAFAYWMTALSELIDMRAFDLHVDTDDESHELQVYGVVIANGRYVGGGFPIAPRATLTDGKLSVVIIPVLPTLELLSAGLNYTLGRSQASGPIRVIEATRVHLTSTPEMQFSVDGEPTREIEATFQLLPGLLRVAVKPAAMNRS